MAQSLSSFFFFNDTATTEIYTLSLHDALPISASASTGACGFGATGEGEGKVATSANLGPGMEGGSSASPVSLSIFWVAGTAAAAVYVAGGSPELNQSGGGATMPQTFAGCPSSK